MGGGSRETRQETVTRLPPQQQAAVNELLGGATREFRSGGPEFFGGNTVAGPTQNELAGRQSAVNFARGQGGELASNAIDANNFFLDPNNLFDLSRIPGFADTQAGITRDATQNLTENILPLLRSSAGASGQFGGTSQQIGEGLAAGRTSEGIADALARMSLDAFSQNLGANQAAIGRAPGLFNLGVAPGDVQANVGAAERGDLQAQINADRERFDFDQNRQLTNLQNFRNLIGQQGTFGGSQTTTSQQPGGNDFLGTIGPLLSLGALLLPGGQAAAPAIAAASGGNSFLGG